MAEPTDMLMPMLREIRTKIDNGQSESKKDFATVNKRLDRIEERQKSFSQALAGDSFMSKMLIGDWEERIEALEAKMKKLEART
jgi:archaellum component FlaC